MADRFSIWDVFESSPFIAYITSSYSDIAFFINVSTHLKNKFNEDIIIVFVIRTIDPLLLPRSILSKLSIKGAKIDCTEKVIIKNV